MNTLWHVRLFNGPILVDAMGVETRRFRSHKVGALLAYLALNLGRPCPREELYEALWPEEDTQLAANRFRVTLSSLRRHLEPEGIQFSTVLDVSEPGRVRLRTGIVLCDTIEYERLLREGRFEAAADFVTGSLLPGFYEEWAIAEQMRHALLWDDVVEEHTKLRSTAAANVSTQERRASELPARSSYPEIAAPPPHNASLPLYLTRFFGRERELQTLRELILEHRQVSLIGMGGIGKTRITATLAEAWEGTCVFVSLVSLPDPGRLYDTLLQALGVAPQSNAPMEEQLIRLLNRRGALLLIVDNAEHISDAIAGMTLLLLQQVPGLRLLVTSRQRLNIAGETVLLMDPLETPDLPAQPERLLEFAAISLFVDRAKSARPDFTLTARNAAAVAKICRQVEGIPLALELAAARITSQTPQQIAHSLDTSLTDLKARQHGLSSRHQSLQAVVEGSLNLLSPAHRNFFCALSVFQGGWSLEAAQAVTGCEETEGYLQHLTRCSLIGVHEDERLGAMRYTLLETVRQFAAQRLTSEAQAIYRERHAHFYKDLTRHADGEDFRIMDQMESDHENILQAMEWYWKYDPTTFTLILYDVLNTWANRGRQRLALEWITRLTAQNIPMENWHQQGIFRIYVDVGRYAEAETVVLLIEKTAHDPIQRTWVHTCRGYIRLLQGAWDEAVECQRKAIEATQEIDGAERGKIMRLVSSNAAMALLGRAQYLADNPDPHRDFQEAEQYMRTGYTDLQEGSRLESSYYHHMMLAQWGRKQEEGGDLYLARALETALAHRHLSNLIKIMMDGAFRLTAKGHREESVQMFSAHEVLREKMGYLVPAYQAARIREHLRTLQTQLGSEVFNRHWQRGLYTPLDILVPSILPQILLHHSS